MKSVVEVKYTVFSVTSNEYKEKTYYQAQVFCPESKECGSIGITENLAREIEPKIGKTITFKGEYNDKFKALNLVGIVNEK